MAPFGDFAGCRAPGGFAPLAPRVASGAARGKPRFLFGYAAWPAADRRIEPAHLRAGHRLGRKLARFDFHGRRTPARCATGCAASCGCSGWAPLSTSTWIAPGDSLEAAARRGRGQRRSPKASTFSKARYRGPLSDRQFVERCWNLEEIGGAYRAFVDRYRPRLAARTRRRSHSTTKRRSSSASGSCTTTAGSPTSTRVCRANSFPRIGRERRRPPSFASTTRHSTGSHCATSEARQEVRNGARPGRVEPTRPCPKASSFSLPRRVSRLAIPACNSNNDDGRRRRRRFR